MDDVVSGQTQSRDYPLLRRRNSISTPNIKVSPALINLLSDQNSSATTSSSSDDLELLSVKPASHSYTSLKDLLLSDAVNSPGPSSAPLVQIGSDISIRNHLVKQAAWAYLQPMSTSPGAAGTDFSTICGRASPPCLILYGVALFGSSIGRSDLSGSGAPDSEGYKFYSCEYS